MPVRLTAPHFAPSSPGHTGEDARLTARHVPRAAPSRQAQVNASAADDSELHLSRITEMTILTIKLIVEFSKRLTFFDHLLKDDQITLLKVQVEQVEVDVEPTLDRVEMVKLEVEVASDHGHRRCHLSSIRSV